VPPLIVISYSPAVSVLAVLGVKVAFVKVSPFTSPSAVPVKVGRVSPFLTVLLSAFTVSGFFATVRLTLLLAAS